MNSYEGAQFDPTPDLYPQAVLRKEINHVVGATAALVAAPSGSHQLVLHCETGSFRLRPGDYLAKTFTALSTTDVCTATAHGFVTGDGPYKVSNSGGGLPGGLDATTLYWIIKVDADTFKLASSYANANAGTAVDITSNGTGTQTIGGLPNAAPGATTTDGYGTELLTAGDRLVVPAPSKFTARGYTGSDVLTYWFL